LYFWIRREKKAQVKKNLERRAIWSIATQNYSLCISLSQMTSALKLLRIHKILFLFSQPQGKFGKNLWMVRSQEIIIRQSSELDHWSNYIFLCHTIYALEKQIFKFLPWDQNYHTSSSKRTFKTKIVGTQSLIELKAIPLILMHASLSDETRFVICEIFRKFQNSTSEDENQIKGWQFEKNFLNLKVGRTIVLSMGFIEGSCGLWNRMEFQNLKR